MHEIRAHEIRAIFGKSHEYHVARFKCNKVDLEVLSRETTELGNNGYLGNTLSYGLQVGVLWVVLKKHDGLNLRWVKFKFLKAMGEI